MWTRISFKRKKKKPSRFGLSNFLSSPFAQDARESSASPHRLQTRAQQLREQSSRNNSNTALGLGFGSNGGLNDQKDGGPLDWYVEGPGRRVGYDDLTAIDWIFEYTKERQRLRVLYSSTPGFVGYLRQLLDASHVWLVLIFTGIAVGILAACIDVASDWLGDIKTGYCKKGDGGGKFYLNKSFCCWGHDGRKPL
jgi:chloride channel 3/4/5